MTSRGHLTTDGAAQKIFEPRQVAAPALALHGKANRRHTSTVGISAAIQPKPLPTRVFVWTPRAAKRCRQHGSRYQGSDSRPLRDVIRKDHLFIGAFSFLPRSWQVVAPPRARMVEEDRVLQFPRHQLHPVIPSAVTVYEPPSMCRRLLSTSIASQGFRPSNSCSKSSMFSPFFFVL